MKKNKEVPVQKAFRLLEALSGVDEELLARSEQATRHAGNEAGWEGETEALTAVGKNEKKNAAGGVIDLAAIRRGGLRLGKTWAALFCIAVMGALTWGGYHFVSDNFRMGSSKDAMNERTAGAMYSAAESAAEDLTENFAISPSLGAEFNGASSDSAQTVGMAAANTEAETVMNQEERYVDQGASESKLEVEYVVGLGESNNAVEHLTSLKQAREIEVLGSYIPTKVPEGYTFESADCTAGRLRVCWTRGMDSIFWTVQLVEDGESLQLVDVNREETYNEYLYEIPLSESVPEEYRASFEQPVCGLEDFSLEFVKKRMIFRGADAGDTQTPRGHFAVLYPENCLVQFNGRGTAEEIYEMFSGLDSR